jgi:DNA-binding HxlR family transcriptional regulator
MSGAVSLGVLAFAEQRAQNGGVLTFRYELRFMKAKSAAAPPVAAMVEDIVGCKWSLAVLGLVRQGVNRPGAMEHAIDGLTAKVLNERLRKLVRYGILGKTSYAEVPPRVEYRLTDFGSRFTVILDQIEALQNEL